MADTAGLPDLRDLKDRLEKAGGEIAAKEFQARKAMAQRVIGTAQGYVGGGPFKKGIKEAAASLRMVVYKDRVGVRLGDTTVVNGWAKAVWQKPMNFGAYHDQVRRPREHRGTKKTPARTIKGWNMFPPFVKNDDVFLYRSIKREAPALFEDYKSLFRSIV